MRPAELGQRIRDARTAAGLRQEDLAAKVGLTRSSIANIERGKQDLTVRRLIAIAEALGVRVSDLLGESRDLTPRLATALAGAQRRLSAAFAEMTDLLVPVMADMERVSAILGTREDNAVNMLPRGWVRMGKDGAV